MCHTNQKSFKTAYDIFAGFFWFLLLVLIVIKINYLNQWFNQDLNQWFNQMI